MTLRTRLARAGLCTALLLTLGVYVAATAAPAAAYEASGDCDNVYATHLYSGIEYDRYSNPASNPAWIRGVRAVIYERATLFQCNTWWFDSEGGASAWIAIAPAPGTPKYGTNSILQIGIVECTWPGYAGSLCDDGGEGDEWIFYAEGGCNGTGPYGKKLAAAPPGGVEFKIERYSPGGFYLKAYEWSTGDLVALVNLASDNFETACWDGDYVQAQWMGERWDGADGIGDDANHTDFTGVRIQQATGGSWLYLGEDGSSRTLDAESCIESTSEDFCTKVFPTSIDIWTQQGS